MPDPGGISITSGGNVRTVEDVEKGLSYLRATNGGATPDSVLRALAVGMSQMTAYFEKLCKASGATLDHRQADGNYPFPGTQTWGYVSIEHVPISTCPDLSVCIELRSHRTGGGRAVFKVIEDNVRASGFAVMLVDAGEAADHRCEARDFGVQAERDGRPSISRRGGP